MKWRWSAAWGPLASVALPSRRALQGRAADHGCHFDLAPEFLVEGAPAAEDFALFDVELFLLFVVGPAAS